MDTAKIFENGKSQAVRLPKNFVFLEMKFMYSASGKPSCYSRKKQPGKPLWMA